MTRRFCGLVALVITVAISGLISMQAAGAESIKEQNEDKELTRDEAVSFMSAQNEKLKQLEGILLSLLKKI